MRATGSTYMALEIEGLRQLLAEKDAEIARLTAIVEDLSDHGCAAERMDMIKAQGAEIVRLKAILWRGALALDNGQLAILEEMRRASGH
jgi:hypothetical protein